MDAKLKGHVFYAMRQIAKRLFEHRAYRPADPNSTTRKLATPLHVCTERDGTFLTVDALVQGKADVDKQNEAGDTPLHQAARAGFTTTIRKLVHAKADLHIKNKALRSPIDAGRAMPDKENAQTGLFCVHEAARDGDLNWLNWLLQLADKDGGGLSVLDKFQRRPQNHTCTSPAALASIVNASSRPCPRDLPHPHPHPHESLHP